jgi:hypothetical protein
VSYYKRTEAAHVDGTPVFQTEADRAAERIVADSIEAAWRCRLSWFGCLAAIDWYAERDGRVVGVLELKSRSHESSQFPTVFLNVRKWLSLQLAAIGLCCPAIFVVKFTDGIRWIPVRDIEAGQARVMGCVRMVKSASDHEPVIDVPIAAMKRL